MKLIRTSVISFFLIAGPALADTSPIVAEAGRAISKGYGAKCDLSMALSKTDPYYDCFDFEPYRIVFEYGRTRGFVVLENGTPVEVFSHTDGDTSFSVTGPWEKDMAIAMAEWWNETLSGNKGNSGSLRDLAAEYVRQTRLSKSEERTLAPASPPAGTEPKNVLEIAPEEGEILRALKGSNPSN